MDDGWGHLPGGEPRSALANLLWLVLLLAFCAALGYLQRLVG